MRNCSTTHIYQFFVVTLSSFLTACCTWGSEPSATPAESLSVLPGFKVELVHSAKSGEGSWISMTFDSQGRLILADDSKGLLRLTLPRLQTGEDSRPNQAPKTEQSAEQQVRMERLLQTDHLRHCRGLLYAHDSLYVSETDGAGIHRLQDLDRDDQFETQNLIVPLVYNSRYGHGANQIRLGPDQAIYVAVGNDVFYPESISAKSPYKGSQNDWILPNPHDGEPDPRTGFILKLNSDGSERVVLNGGLRNQVDVDFNAEGEMFTWDADMEWDVGLPWYRPTRINHVVSAGEYGWRWGTGKWPNWFPDSLPSNHDTNLGSPTGIAFGTTSQWPSRFKNAMVAADWQHGRLLLIEFHEKGASYIAQSIVLAEGSPLNVSDLEFGPDGALYFITGGRGSQSGLYRINITDSEKALQSIASLLPVAPESTPDAKTARSIRKQLECWHTAQSPAAIDEIWPHLASEDPWIRFAARVALENQPLENWHKRLETEVDGNKLRTAWMALARIHAMDNPISTIEGLLRQSPVELEQNERIWWLRTLQLNLIRHSPNGIQDPILQRKILDVLESIALEEHFPTNWLVGELLVALESPAASDKLAALLTASTTQEEQIQHAKSLSRLKTNWSTEARTAMMNWLVSNRRLPGGRLVEATLELLKKDFLDTFDEADQRAYSELIAKLNQPLIEIDPASIVPTRTIVENWELGKLNDLVSKANNSPRDFSAGRRIASEASCLRCHVLGERGSHIGPDLSNVGHRFDQFALLESIVEPSKQIDAKYSISNYQLSDGRTITGRAASVSANQLAIETNPLTGETVQIQRAEIEESKVSTLSPMPAGLLDTFTVEEIADLIAYLRSSTTGKEVPQATQADD